jgi:carboxymethylenebutenolidase
MPMSRRSGGALRNGHSPWFIALVAVFVCAAPIAQSARAQSRAPDTVYFSIDETDYAAEIYLPEGAGPFPTVVYNHGGAPGFVDARAFAEIGPVFAERGWAFFAPYRQGAAGAADADAAIAAARSSAVRDALPELAGLVLVALVLAVVLTRNRPLWIRAAVGVVALGIAPGGYYVVARSAGATAMIGLLETVRLTDHLAAVSWLRQQSFVDPYRIATLGNSHGGIVTLFAAENSEYCAAVDAAGAAQSWGKSTDLRRRLAQAARTSRSPVLFIQAENDYSTEPSRILSREVENGGEYSARILYPAFGESADEGHAFAWRGGEIWADDVIDFLGRFCGADLVAREGPFLIYSSFWQNLHHVLYAEGWRQRTDPNRPERRRRGPLPPFPGSGRMRSAMLAEPLQGELTPEERAAWDEAVEYYAVFVAPRDLLFGLAATRQALVRAGSGPPEFLPDRRQLELLQSAAPVYRKYWWPEHDAANRAWIAEATPKIRSLSPAVPDRLEQLYGTPWFEEEVRVDIVRVADTAGAYTAFDPPPAHITISSGEPNNQGWNAAEILFQEASRGLEPEFRRTFYAAGVAGDFGGAPHRAVLFYLTGEVVREALMTLGIEHEPYLYSTGRLEEDWPGLREPLETHWRPYLDGDTTLEAAAAAFAADLGAEDD